jgi:BioD-like phosphotransacetylase family protein
MTNAIYLTTTEPFSGKSIIALGLMNLLAGKTEKIAYFKPVISCSAGQKDNHLETMIRHFGLTTPYEDMYAFTYYMFYQLILLPLRHLLNLAALRDQARLIALCNINFLLFCFYN